MAPFHFVHAADLHIDSPLIGLASKSEALSQLVDDASRKALDNLVSLAIDENCRFMLIAGDLFDGEWRDFRTGLFFVERMRRLREAGIPVFIVLGNHDAENKFTKRLEFSDNVHVFPAQRPETIRLDDLEVAIHGQSFPRRDVIENLALGYPARAAGYFNIGLLHTACTGREGHQSYAPCSVDDMISRGYDYWALGHVHTREILNQNPLIIFPGNLQGRNARETGPKGVTLVTVDSGHVIGFEHRPLDIVRWSADRVDVRRCADAEAVVQEARTRLEQLARQAGDRALAVRLHICGETLLHEELVRRKLTVFEDIATAAASVSSQIWIEKIEPETKPPTQEVATDPSVAGRLQLIAEELSRSEEFRRAASQIISEIRAKTPSGSAEEEFFNRLAEYSTVRAAELAKAIAAGGGK